MRQIRPVNKETGKSPKEVQVNHQGLVSVCHGVLFSFLNRDQGLLTLLGAMRFSSVADYLP